MSERYRRIIGAVVALVALGVIVVGLVSGATSEGDRAEALERRLRCPVCQSESIADSGSETARELRDVIAEQIAAGKSDSEIIDFFVARYGEWVLLDPPAKGRGLLLWALPVLGLGVGVVAILSRRRKIIVSPTESVAAQKGSELP